MQSKTEMTISQLADINAMHCQIPSMQAPYGAYHYKQSIQILFRVFLCFTIIE